VPSARRAIHVEGFHLEVGELLAHVSVLDFLFGSFLFFRFGRLHNNTTNYSSTFKKSFAIMEIAIYTLTSELHDEKAIAAVTQEFLSSLRVEYTLKGGDYTDYGSQALSIIYVRTGGTEGIFRRLLPQLRLQSQKPFYLLTSGKSNSLAASMEILSFLQQNGMQGEIIHGSADYISHRLEILGCVSEARRKMKGCRLGIIGQPSDWLISSMVEPTRVKECLGIELVEIPMDELLQAIDAAPETACQEDTTSETIRKALPMANRIYGALQNIVDQYHLQGFTLRCFDLLTAVHNTGCMALARLNAQGIVAGCEGDVPAMLSMMIVQSLLGISGFQANPASINPETGEMLFAHCTIPFNMVERYELDTHFESGIGVGIRGYMKEGPVTIFKVSGDLSRSFIAEGTLVRSEAKSDLCRTQQVIQLADSRQTDYFLTHPIGNHHIILPGHHRELLENILK
jgi:L-fucose isomerase-like protein